MRKTRLSIDASETREHDCLRSDDLQREQSSSFWTAAAADSVENKATTMHRVKERDRDLVDALMAYRIASKLRRIAIETSYFIFAFVIYARDIVAMIKTFTCLYYVDR